ncbi:MAG TPA: MFS transporter [Stellaceae bacterium]|nr:MFS transporter [Stellaceae bacterium]
MMENDTATLGDVAAAPSVTGSLTQQWYLVGVLTVIYVLNYIDRGALNLIVNPLKADLHISDVQVSLLIGLSFAALYSLLCIPAGYLADIVSRRKLLGTAICFWSCAATISGFAGSYAQLFAGRIGLGVGEAVLPPTAYSLLRDGVRPQHRARAFSCYHLGTGVGNALGALIGGSLFALGAAGAFATLPILSSLRPWQLVIAVPGLCGIVLSYLVFTLREPPRPPAGDSASFGEMFRYVSDNRRLYTPLFLSIVFGPMAVSAWGAWQAAAIGRIWGLAVPQIGHSMGLLSLCALPFDALIIGFLMDRVSRGGTRRDRTIFLAIGIAALQVVPSLMILYAPSIQVMWGSYAASMLLTNANGVAGTLSLAQVTPGRFMGKVTSFYFLIANLLGLALGPTVTALVAEWFFTGKLAIVGAMSWCYPVLTALNLLCLAVFALRLRGWQAARPS